MLIQIWMKMMNKKMKSKSPKRKRIIFNPQCLSTFLQQQALLERMLLILLRGLNQQTGNFETKREILTVGERDLRRFLKS